MTSVLIIYRGVCLTRQIVIRCVQQIRPSDGFVRLRVRFALFRVVGKHESQLTRFRTFQLVIPFAPPALPGFVATTR